MLTGEYRHSVDAKNRLFIPAKHREELGTSFVIVKDVRGPRLKVFSMQAWEAYLEPIKHQDRKIVDQLMRFLHSTAIYAEHRQGSRDRRLCGLCGNLGGRQV